jgi:hypothetical protein
VERFRSEENVNRLVLIALLVWGCSRERVEEQPPAPEPQPEPEPPARVVEPPPPVVALPDGFRRVGRPERHDAYLGPEAAWREAVSRLSELRAEARGAGEDLLVSFETGALIATSRSGRWRLWSLPEGLALEGVPAHVLLGADLGLVAFGPDGTQISGEKEVAVVTAQVAEEGRQPREFRLVIKAGTTFRSISTAG